MHVLVYGSNPRLSTNLGHFEFKWKQQQQHNQACLPLNICDWFFSCADHLHPKVMPACRRSYRRRKISTNFYDRNRLAGANKWRARRRCRAMCLHRATKKRTHRRSTMILMHNLYTSIASSIHHIKAQPVACATSTQCEDFAHLMDLMVEWVRGGES